MKLIFELVVVLVAFQGLMLGVSGAVAESSGFKNLKIPYSVDPDTIVTHHSIFPPILSEYFSAGLGHWDFGLATAITDDYIRLVPSRQSKEGYLWNDVPSHLTSWTAHIGFRIHSKASLGGDGFAFWYAESQATQGGPLFGGPSKFRGLGVIFDTFDNNGAKDNPAVTVILGDGREEFRTENDMADQKLASCSFNFRNTDSKDVVEAILDYDGESLRITLHSLDRQMNCLIVNPITLPDGYYFGLTAHTGHLADNHDIHYFTVTANEAARAREEEQERQAAGSGTGDANNGALNAEGEPLGETGGKGKTFPEFSHSTEKQEKEKHRTSQE